MSTNREVVTDALRELTVLDADESASNEDAQLGLRTMNRMFALLEADGIDLGYPPQDSLTDEFPLDDTIKAQCHYLLAATLRPSYPSVTPDPTLYALAESARSQLQRTSVLANMQEADLSNLPRGEARRCRY